LELYLSLLLEHRRLLKSDLLRRLRSQKLVVRELADRLTWLKHCREASTAKLMLLCLLLLRVVGLVSCIWSLSLKFKSSLPSQIGALLMLTVLLVFNLSIAVATRTIQPARYSRILHYAVDIIYFPCVVSCLDLLRRSVRMVLWLFWRFDYLSDNLLAVVQIKQSTVIRNVFHKLDLDRIKMNILKTCQLD
jgi:hypothetical protein